MNKNDFIQIFITFFALLTFTPILGSFIAKVFSSEKNFLSPVIEPFENFTYKICGIDKKHEMTAKEYGISLLIFNLFGFLIVFILQITQSHLPLNPEHLPNVTWHLAINTAVSFVTNTNWQAYSGENTLSYLTQFAGLTVQNFLSAATALAVLLILIRGLIRKKTNELGNFWVDLVKSVYYILIPISLLVSILLVSQGVVQNFSHYKEIQTIENVKQVLPMGPAASQIAIKQIGTNGGGFFGVNSAHPYENPTPFSNWIELLSILLIPAALVYAFGILINARKQAFYIFLTMFLLLIAGVILSLYSEYSHNAVLGMSHIMEGKETRFGITNSVLWSVFTTAASNGSVNAMHSSLSPLSGFIAMINMMLGEIIFGGIGCGLYGMLLFIILTVFIAGLMVGRTPEYLGKKIESYEIKMAIIGVLSPSIFILLGSAFSLASQVGMAGLSHKGPHGFSEMIYAFTSAAANNGSAFAGLSANSIYFNLILSLGMIIGRFAVLFPVIAIAGSLAKKNISPISTGTFTTDNALFMVLLISVILIVGALTFFPSLALGPIIEHLLMNSGVSF